MRKNDFRASGSGHILYEREEIDTGNHPLVVELSYGYALAGYKDKCPGFWDENLEWHDGFFDPQEWQIEDLIKQLE